MFSIDFHPIHVQFNVIYFFAKFFMYILELISGDERVVITVLAYILTAWYYAVFRGQYCHFFLFSNDTLPALRTNS